MAKIFLPDNQINSVLAKAGVFISRAKGETVILLPKNMEENKDGNNEMPK